MTGDGTTIEAGQQVGPYVLQSLLGRGGMGEVWRASDTVREREVALKLIIGSSSRDPALAARFRRECRLAARLWSAHVVPIHDFGEIDDRLFLDMRLVPGPDLRSVLDRHPEGVDPAAARDVIVQVADALDSAHEQELVHRDVKPSNVLIDASRGRWFCYLADFGVAVPMDSAPDTRITRTGTTIGTPAYLAPELLPGPRRATVGTDVYALGCLLYELLTGRAPYAGGNDAAVLFAHAHAEPPLPSAHRPWLAGFDAVVRTALAKDPAQRFASAGELARALPAAPPPPGPPGGGGTQTTVEQPGSGRRKRRALWAVLSVVALLVLAGGGYLLADRTGLLGPATPTAVAVRPLAAFTITNSVFSSPDGSLAYVVGEDEQGHSLFTVDAENGRVTSRVATDPDTTTVVTNPDATRAYLAATGTDKAPGDTVQVVDIPNNRVIADVSVGGRPYYEAVSEDGSRLFVTTRPTDPSKPGGLAIVDTTRNILLSNTPVGVSPSGVALSPDGKRVYVSNYGADDASNGTVSVIDTATGRVDRTVPTGPEPYDLVVLPDGKTLYVATRSNSDPGTFDIIDTETFARTQIPAPTTAYSADIAVNPDGDRIVVLNFGTEKAPGRTASIFDVELGTPFPVAQIPGRPGNVSVTPDGHHAFVATYGSTGGGIWIVDFP